ncbi:MAG: hypothetical protein HGB08_02225 [Candidatus Moranbacteria bacterium]|nr:hypothetical protein [Candidatus Moranbacteria bacterium]
MDTSRKSSRLSPFAAFGLFVLGLESLSVILAIAGIFYQWIILAYLIIALFSLGFVFLKKNKYEASSLWVVSFLIFISVFYAWNASPSIFSGRDQGSFSEAAIRLAENHRLEFKNPVSEEFFKIYGPGTALNFPGFSYTKDGSLMTNFSLGYISWLAGFYALFGMAGFSIANALTLFLFLTSFYFLLRQYMRVSPALIGMLFILSSFVFNWLPKITLGENLAMGFLWFAILEAVLFFKKKEKLPLFISISTLLILTLTRIESWAFLSMLLIAFLWQQKSWTKAWKILKDKKFLIAFFAISAIVVAGIVKNNPFYISSLKGLIHSFEPQKESLGFMEPLLYLWKVLTNYAIIEFVILGFSGVVYFIKKKKYDMLVPAIIVLPSIIYLVHPGISPDHPWMLRRFAFSVIPAGILYSIFLLESFCKKRIRLYIVSILIIFTNILITAPYFQFRENAELLKQTEDLSRNFSANDLVLLDRETDGDGWNMISGPMNFLFQKQAVYFFNPNDLSRIDTSRFEHVYLISPDSNIDFYERYPAFRNLSPISSYSLTTSFYGNTLGYADLPIIQEKTTAGEIYLLTK